MMYKLLHKPSLNAVIKLNMITISTLIAYIFTNNGYVSCRIIICNVYFQNQHGSVKRNYGNYGTYGDDYGTYGSNGGDYGSYGDKRIEVRSPPELYIIT